MDIKIIVAAHKRYRMPADPMYIPVHVGKNGKEGMGYVGDDTGDNISSLNPHLCELTGIYWAWRNISAEYIGLVHYRRHFTALPLLQRIGKDKFDCILSKKELESVLKDCDLVLPKMRKYYIESLRSHFSHTPNEHKENLAILRDVIQELQPGYVDAFDAVVSRTHAHMFNIFIMKKDVFDRYCEWLFPIMIETERRIDYTYYSPLEARTAGAMGEFMIDTWNEVEGIAYRELPVMFMERINWLKKGGRFLVRKFFPQR